MPRHPRTILVIDDDELALTRYARVLQLEGCLVATASTATAGLHAADTGVPDAIVLDLELPDVEDGLGVLRKLRNQDRDTPIAIVTGRGELDGEAQAEVSRMGAFISYKPLRSGECRALVRSLLEIPAGPGHAG